MTIKISSIKKNITKERDGDVIAIPEWPGVSLNVRSTEYPPYKTGLEQLVQRFARKYRNKSVPADERDGEVGKLVADNLLLGWTGFDEPYEPEFAKDLISSPEGREFVQKIFWAAAQVGFTEIEFVEESIKNSEKPSDTN